MDSIVSVARHAPVSSRRGLRDALRLIALAALASALGACGGGGGGGDDDGGGGNPTTGSIAATVVDQFDAPINGVTIRATINNATRTATTGAEGTATVTQVQTGSVTVTASAEGLVDPGPQTVTVDAGATATVSFTMQRVVEAAGGIRSAAQVSNNGTTFTFRVRVIVIDEAFNPVPDLPATAFSLANCAAGEEFPPVPNCVRFNVPDPDEALDQYTVANNNAPNGDPEEIPAPAPVPYAAGMLFDSSGSIADSDPTDARIFATKEYLNDVVAGNMVMLAAFADQDQRQLPNEGVNYFPCDPCTPAFTGDGDSLFASLDSLATLEGGGTPLYDSLQEMVITVDETATTPSTLQRQVVLFSDGRDIYCREPPGSFEFCTQRRSEVVAEAEGRQVNIFTVGLASENVDSLAMAELALRNGGAYMFAERPTQLISIFGILDRLLSDSLPSYEMEFTVNANTPGTFAPGRAVIGQLTVDAGATSFTLPLAVQIE